MADDFTKYEKMRSAGEGPEDVYRAAATDGVDAIARVRLIRAVYSLSPGQAKEVIVRADGESSSLDEHQGKIADALLELTAPSPATDNKYDGVMRRINYYYVAGDGRAVSAGDVERLSSLIGHPLPDDYSVFLRKYGLTAGRGVVKFGNLDRPDEEESSVEVFYGIRADDSYDLLGTRESFADDLPSNLLPIASSPGGEIVLSLAGDNLGKAYWWSSHRGSANPYDDCELIAYSFDSFMNSLRLHEN